MQVQLESLIHNFSEEHTAILQTLQPGTTTPIHSSMKNIADKSSKLEDNKLQHRFSHFYHSPNTRPQHETDGGSDCASQLTEHTSLGMCLVSNEPIDMMIASLK